MYVEQPPGAALDDTVTAAPGLPQRQGVWGKSDIYQAIPIGAPKDIDLDQVKGV